MQDCDPALLRRFSRRIEVPLPDSTAREAFFQSMLDRPELDSALGTGDVTLLAELTVGYSGSDLADVCRTAALAPVRQVMLQQRQQLGCKRRRTGLMPLPSLFQTSSRVSEDSSAVSGSPADSTACTAEWDLTAPVLTGGRGGCKAAAEGAPMLDSLQQPAAGAVPVKLRALVMADFQSALALVKPAAVDAGVAVA